MVKPFQTMNIYINNERQECKADPVRGSTSGRAMEGEYSQCTLYTCMKIEH
jgi:hypothetical protein